MPMSSGCVSPGRSLKLKRICVMRSPTTESYPRTNSSSRASLSRQLSEYQRPRRRCLGWRRLRLRTFWRLGRCRPLLYLCQILLRPLPRRSRRRGGRSRSGPLSGPPTLRATGPLRTSPTPPRRRHLSHSNKNFSGWGSFAEVRRHPVQVPVVVPPSVAFTALGSGPFSSGGGIEPV